MRRFGTDNVGIATGKPSGVTIVDVDDFKLVDGMLARFGATPLLTRTPSGGVHLWYRWAGEASTNLRRDGLAVDIKADGGMVVVPPSMRPSTGVRYRFERGSWDDLTHLPKINPGALQSTITHARTIPVGMRSNTIFRRLLREVPYCDDQSALLDVAQTMNDNHTEAPLPRAELKRAVLSAWTYETTGRNWVAQEARVQLSGVELDRLAPHGYALMLWCTVRRYHWDLGRGPFALCPEAMVRDGVISDWGVKRYRSAIQVLIERGFLIRVHRGGKGAGDPHKYRSMLPTPESASPPVLAIRVP